MQQVLVHKFCLFFRVNSGCNKPRFHLQGKPIYVAKFSPGVFHFESHQFRSQQTKRRTPTASPQILVATNHELIFPRWLVHFEPLDANSGGFKPKDHLRTLGERVERSDWDLKLEAIRQAGSRQPSLRASEPTPRMPLKKAADPGSRKRAGVREAEKNRIFAGVLFGQKTSGRQQKDGMLLIKGAVLWQKKKKGEVVASKRQHVFNDMGLLLFGQKRSGTLKKTTQP